MGSTSKARKLVALAMHRVVTRSLAAGRSLSYDRLLAETAAEVDVLLAKRGEADVRLLRQARKQLTGDQVRLAAAAECRAAIDAERQLADLDTTLGPPSWHPEHSENDL